MPSELSTAIVGQPKVTIEGPLRRLQADERNRGTAKGLATARRHREKRRAERLAEIDEQIADGTLIIRQITDAEHEPAPAPPRQPAEPTRGCVVRTPLEQEGHRIADGVHDDSLQAVFAVALGSRTYNA
jgi:hypothetical protein